MAKKKDKPQTINNIDELHLEIDYDKLAEAIVKAQENVQNHSTQKRKVGFWKSIGLILTNKESKTGMRGAILLSEVMGFLFNALALLGVVSAVIIVAAAMIQADWTADILKDIEQAAVYGYLFAFSLAIALIFRAVANEIKAEKDRNYIISVFSGIVSFAALIVALVALFKGVG